MPTWTATPVDRTGQPLGPSRKVSAPDADSRFDPTAPPEGPIAAILEWVGYDPDRAKAALVAELDRDQDNQRSGVIGPLTKMLKSTENPEG